jgi:hypothetical protein
VGVYSAIRVSSLLPTSRLPVAVADLEIAEVDGEGRRDLEGVEDGSGGRDGLSATRFSSAAAGTRSWIEEQGLAASGGRRRRRRGSRRRSCSASRAPPPSTCRGRRSSAGPVSPLMKRSAFEGSVVDASEIALRRVKGFVASSTSTSLADLAAARDQRRSRAPAVTSSARTFGGAAAVDPDFMPADGIEARARNCSERGGRDRTELAIASWAIAALARPRGTRGAAVPTRGRSIRDPDDGHGLLQRGPRHAGNPQWQGVRPGSRTLQDPSGTRAPDVKRIPCPARHDSSRDRRAGVPTWTHGRAPCEADGFRSRGAAAVGARAYVRADRARDPGHLVLDPRGALAVAPGDLGQGMARRDGEEPAALQLVEMLEGVLDLAPADPAVGEVFGVGRRPGEPVAGAPVRELSVLELVGIEIGERRGASQHLSRLVEDRAFDPLRDVGRELVGVGLLPAIAERLQEPEVPGGDQVVAPGGIEPEAPLDPLGEEAHTMREALDERVELGIRAGLRFDPRSCRETASRRSLPEARQVVK